MASKVQYYKSCPLKKRPIVLEEEEEEIEVVELTQNQYYDNFKQIEEQPQDLSLKRKASHHLDEEPTTKREYVLDLTKKLQPNPKRYRSASPVSYFNTFESSVLLSPPADLNNDIKYATQLHMSHNNNPYQNAFVSAAGCHPIPALWTPYQTDAEEIYASPAASMISAVSPHSVYSYQQMTPPSSPGSDASSEPEDLSLRNDIPLPALFHIAASSETAKKYRFKCDKCNKMYSTSMGLSKHQQFHCPAAECNQEKKQHACQECGKLYTTVGALKMHIRTHTLPCKCPICGKAFSRPWLLQGHIRTHTGEKPFQCTDCPRSFADRSNLRAHQQTHVDVKKYACKMCHKSFSRMSLLNKHTSSNCAITIV